MNKLALLFLFILSAFYFASCGDDDTVVVDVFEYHAHIHAPDTSTKDHGDTMHIHVEFESHTGEIVHNVNVRIYSANDNTEVYSAPIDGHVHEISGTYEWHDDFILSTANGVMPHTDYIIEAKVWGHDAGEEEEISSSQFHVHM